jgi:hypothetical protein
MINKDTHTDMLFMEKLNDAYDIWDELNGKIGGIEGAVIEFQKLFLQFNGKLKDIEKRRLLLHGLTTAELSSEKEKNKQRDCFDSHRLCIGVVSFAQCCLRKSSKRPLQLKMASFP